MGKAPLPAVISCAWAGLWLGRSVAGGNVDVKHFLKFPDFFGPQVGNPAIQRLQSIAVKCVGGCRSPKFIKNLLLLENVEENLSEDSLSPSIYYIV